MALLNDRLNVSAGSAVVSSMMVTEIVFALLSPIGPGKDPAGRTIIAAPFASGSINRREIHTDCAITATTARNSNRRFTDVFIETICAFIELDYAGS